MIWMHNYFQGVCSTLPCLVWGWQGGDMTTTSGASLTSSFLVKPAMFLFSRFVLGWLCLYTSLLTVLMSMAATTSTWGVRISTRSCKILSPQHRPANWAHDAYHLCRRRAQALLVSLPCLKIRCQGKCHTGTVLCLETCLLFEPSNIREHHQLIRKIWHKWNICLANLVAMECCSNFSPLCCLWPGVVFRELLVIVPHCEGGETCSCSKWLFYEKIAKLSKRRLILHYNYYFLPFDKNSVMQAETCLKSKQVNNY